MDVNEYRNYLFQNLAENPGQINHLQPQQLMLVLNTFHVIDKELTKRMDDIQANLQKTTENDLRVTTRRAFFWLMFVCLLGYAGLVIFCAYCLDYVKIDVFAEYFANMFISTTCMAIFIGYSVVFLIYFLITHLLNMHSKREDRDLLDEVRRFEKEAWEIIQVSATCLAVGQRVLPSYYLNDTALSAMLEYLRNHRVATLSGAINLYEQEAWQREISSEANNETNRLLSFTSELAEKYSAQ